MMSIFLPSNIISHRKEKKEEKKKMHCLIENYFFLQMMVRRRKAEQNSGLRPSCNDQVNLAVGALILTNLLLDGPHIIVHILAIPSKDLAFILIHVVYRLHIALDPFIFIGLNLHYRRKILRRGLACCPACASLVGGTLATTTAESSSRRPDSVGQKVHPSCSTQV